MVGFREKHVALDELAHWLGPLSHCLTTLCVFLFTLLQEEYLSAEEFEKVRCVLSVLWSH
jgi:hypothetical protein